MCWKLQAVSSIKCDDSTWQRLASCRSMQKKKKKKWTVVEDEEGSGVMSGCQTWWWLRRGAGRYLESLPVGPNHSDSVLTPGLFFQSPQLPASLFGGWAGRDREREQMKREKVRGGGGGGGGGTLFFFFFCLRSANITHTHTHTQTHCTPAICDHHETVKVQLYSARLQKTNMAHWGSFQHLSGELL